jgi:hypothetical protein
MGGHRPEGNTTDPKNTRMEEMRRRCRRIDASSEGGWGPEGVVVPQIEWN